MNDCVLCIINEHFLLFVLFLALFACLFCIEVQHKLLKEENVMVVFSCVYVF